jgi:hypothetical protein
MSASQLDTYISCPTKWYFRYVIGRVKPASGKMIKGKIFHRLFALTYGEQLTFTEASKQIIAEYPGNPDVPLMIQLFLEYQEKYPNVNIIEFNNKPGVEVPFKITYDDNIEIIGFIDYLSAGIRKKYITDIKVTGMYLSDYYFQGFELSYQSMLYSFVCKKYFSNIEGFMIDGVMHRKNKGGYSTDFKRQFFPLNANLDTFEREMYQICKYILEYRDKGPEYFMHHYNNCVNKYGKCEYYDVCMTKECYQKDYLMSDEFIDYKRVKI